MDKLWADRRWLASPRDYGDRDETDWRIDMTSPDMALIENKGVLYPQARVGVPTLDNGNAWSAILGAFGGAGTVLFIALVVLVWKKPRRRGLPMLAPMDVAQNAISGRRADGPPDGMEWNLRSTMSGLIAKHWMKWTHVN